MNEHTDLTAFVDRLTRWFEARLDDTVAPRGAFAQLFGLEVVDPDGLDDGRPDAVRVFFICEGPDEFSVLAAPGTACVCDYDATATVEYGWRRLPSGPGRPGQFARKERTRTVRVMWND